MLSATLAFYKFVQDIIIENMLLWSDEVPCQSSILNGLLKYYIIIHYITAEQAYKSVTRGVTVWLFFVCLPQSFSSAAWWTLSLESACVSICQIMNKQLPRPCTMHNKSVCWNTSLLCCPWPCPFQTTSHLCQIALQRETRKTEPAVWKALWTLRPTGTIQWIQSKPGLTASILAINNTLQRVNKKLKGQSIFSNLEVHSALMFTSICHV